MREDVICIYNGDMNFKIMDFRVYLGFDDIVVFFYFWEDGERQKERQK